VPICFVRYVVILCQTLKLLATMRDREAPAWDSDKVILQLHKHPLFFLISFQISGGIYITKEHVDLINRAYCMYTVSNPLHLDLFPSVRKMEAEVIRMTASKKVRSSIRSVT
jgi:hypothetical protein